jgi:hypothetical protein
VKKKLSIFFLVILSLSAIYKVGFFTFYQLNKDYIAENYCVNKDRPITMCYGSCFLEKGLSLADQVPNPESFVSTLKFEMQEFLVDDVVIPTCCNETILIFSFLPTPSITEGVDNSIFRPPLA